MIRLKQPTLVLHSHDAPGYKPKMHISWNLPKGATPHDVVSRILDGQDYSPDLQNVVINSHGSSGKIWAGGLNRLSIKRSNVDLFGLLRNKITCTIWIFGCEVAKGAKGSNFCANMAKAASCNVIASDIVQLAPGISHPYGYIDYYEGTVYRWNPSGTLSICSSNGAGAPGVYS